MKLTAADRKILADRSTPPKTAADYYFALPASCFSIIENSAERRATFIDQESLSGSYLHAEKWFECDGGGFDVTIRVFDSANGPLVAVSSSTYGGITLYEDRDPGPGELESITLQRPRFWRYSDNAWVAVDDSILPMISSDFVLDRYRNHYKAHLHDADQTKFIWLACELPRSGNTIRVTGRENFMDPSKDYVWASYAFDGRRFRTTGTGAR